MPKPTFFNLSTEKRERLLNAAREEFSKVPLHEALISNIVKAAGIPRGSFYQYFADKEDIFYFLLEKFMKETKENFILDLQRLDGDLFDTFIELFISMLNNFQKQENRNFFKHTFLNTNYKVENTLTHHFLSERLNEPFFEMTRFINCKKFNISDEQELIHIVNIMVAVTIHNLTQSFAKELPFAVAIKNYTFEIELLKKGFYREVHQ